MTIDIHNLLGHNRCFKEAIHNCILIIEYFIKDNNTYRQAILKMIPTSFNLFFPVIKYEVMYRVKWNYLYRSIHVLNRLFKLIFVLKYFYKNID